MKILMVLNILLVKKILEIALAKDPADMSPNEIGALKIEHVLFRLYNNIDLKTPFTSEEAMDMREAIDALHWLMHGSVGNIPSDNSNMTKAAEASKRLSILVGCNHRFYPLQ
jgi:hypothetical protein